MVAAALVRAQSSGFQAKRAELRKQAEAAQQAEGLAGTANRKALFAKYPTPEITLARPLVLAPGGTGALSVPGKFAPGTAVFAGSDAITLADVVVAAASVKASVTAKAGLPPQWARVYALAPVSLAETWTPVFIGSPPAFSLTASNGWTVKVTPEAKAFTVSEREARVSYKAEYFKPGETTPFQTASGPLEIGANSEMPGRYNLMLGAGQAGSAMEEYQELSKKMVAMMQAGKVGTKEFDALQKRAEAAQARWMKEMEVQVADPASMQKKQDDFGCETISLTVDGARVTGSVSCGKNVGTLQVTGTTP
jgi:hypothetical protein